MYFLLAVVSGVFASCLFMSLAAVAATLDKHPLVVVGFVCIAAVIVVVVICLSLTTSTAAAVQQVAVLFILLSFFY